jgi:hypothetical protein
MPRGDGTGPRGQGRGTGRGTGRGGARPGGRGRGGVSGAGPGGNCVCPNCGTKAAHQLRVPCYEQKCPNCGAVMTRR